MKIETDRVRILAGLYKRVTIGSPLALVIENKDWANWKGRRRRKVSVPRPGHADLAGALKYGYDDIQKVIERASARETAIRTAIGAVAKRLLAEFGIDVTGHVTAIGTVSASPAPSPAGLARRIQSSPVFCADRKAATAMVAEIDRARSEGQSLGGVFEIIAKGVPPGLGSYVHWDRRLDGRMAGAILSIPSVKGTEIGEAVENSRRHGSEAHDEITGSAGRLRHKTNRAGGIEGGVSNGEAIVVRGYAKPIPTLGAPLSSIDLKSMKKTKAPLVRSDVCVVPAISVIGEALVAWEIAAAFVEKFSGDSLEDMKANYGFYKRRSAGK
jgi:chorismate synthase